MFTSGGTGRKHQELDDIFVIYLHMLYDGIYGLLRYIESHSRCFISIPPDRNMQYIDYFLGVPPFEN